MIFICVTVVMFQSADWDKVRNFYSPKKYELTQEELKYIPPQEQRNGESPVNSTQGQYQSDFQNYANAYNQKDYKNAVFYGERIAYRQTNDVDFLDAMGYAYLKLQDYKDSTIYYKKTLAVDPNDKYAKHNLEYIREHMDENEQIYDINNRHSSAKAPAKLYRLVKTDLGAQVKQEVDGILDLVWQEINGRIILQTMMDKDIPINILPGDFRDHTDLKWSSNYKYVDVDGIDISEKTIKDLNNTNLDPWTRIYNFNTFLHEFGHAFAQIKDPKSSNSLEQELGVSMIGYNISYKMVYHRYMTDQEIKERSMGVLAALLSDDHSKLPVYSGFNKEMKRYAIYMPNPALYTDLVGMYKQLLAQGKTQHVPNLDALVK